MPYIVMGVCFAKPVSSESLLPLTFEYFCFKISFFLRLNRVYNVFNLVAETVTLALDYCIVQTHDYEVFSLSNVFFCLI